MCVCVPTREDIQRKSFRASMGTKVWYSDNGGSTPNRSESKYSRDNGLVLSGHLQIPNDEGWKQAKCPVSGGVQSRPHIRAILKHGKRYALLSFHSPIVG